MIPLVRPRPIDFKAVATFFENHREQNVYTNFGPIEEMATHLVVSKCCRKKAHPVLTVNGTAAIEVAIRSLHYLGKIKKRIAVPDFTHSGTLLAAARCAKPRIFPCNEHTWQIEESAFRDPDVGTVIVVSPFGHAVNTKYYDALAEDYGKQIVYDFAGAWGKFPETDWPVCYSFHATKNVNAGEAGCVIFSGLVEATYGKMNSNFGTKPDRSLIDDCGYNFKIDEFRAAAICVALRNETEFDQRVSHHRQILQEYAFALDKTNPELKFLQKSMLSLTVLGGFSPEVAEKLERLGPQKGVVCKRYFPPFSSMDSLKELKARRTIGGFSRNWMQGCVALPADVTKQEFEKVVDFVKLNERG